MDVRQAITSIIAAHKSVPLVNTPADTIEAGEIPSARTANARIFNLGNGQRKAHIYACPIHFRDKDGTFKSIDPTVKRKPLADPLQTHKYEVKSGLYHAHFDADRPWDYRLEIGDSWIEYEAQFDESDVLTIKVETSRVGVKETITLIDRTAPTKLSWKVTRSGDGIITPPPVAVDSDGKPVIVKVSQDGDILTYDVDVTGAVFPVMVDPTAIVANAPAKTVRRYTGTVYNTERNATVGHDIINYFTIGQGFINPNYYIWHAFAEFTIPDTPNIVAVSFFGCCLSDWSTNDFNINSYTATQSSPLDVTDFELFDGWQASGAYTGTVLNNTTSSSSYPGDESLFEIPFNAAGIAAVTAKLDNIFKMVMLSSRLCSSTDVPTGNDEGLAFYSTDTAGKEPYLSVTYAVVSTVTTQAATDVLTTSCTGNGNITATGGMNCTRRGFCYKVGTSGDPTTADSVAYDDGDFGTGAYTKAITGLTNGTGYRVRAYAVNPAGTGYGSTVQVTTEQVYRLLAGQADTVFDSSLLLSRTFEMAGGQANIIFDSALSMSRMKKFTAQSDIVFDAVLEMCLAKIMAAQSDIVFDAAASMYADKNMAGQAAIVFDSLMAMYAERAMTGQANIVFDSALLVSRDINLAAQSDIIISTYIFMGLDGDSGLITRY